MPLKDIVDLQIGTKAAAITQQGFGTMLILSCDTYKPDRVSWYSDTDGMISDGYQTTDAAYMAASAAFAQNPAPEQVAIGRLLNKPTQRYALAAAAVKNGATYQVTVGKQTVSYVSDGTATNDEIVTGIKALIDALPASGVTTALVGSVGSQTMTITATVAGAFVSVSVGDTTLLTLTQTHADPGVAADLAALMLADGTWYGLINPWNSPAMALAIAAWVETNKRLFACVTADCDTLGSGTGDVFTSLKTAAYARTLPLYHGIPGEFMGAALFGLMLPKDPGSATFHLKTLAGVSADNLNDTQRQNLANKLGTAYYTISGRNVTVGGLVSANEYADIVVGSDWLQARMQERIFGTLADADKVPYTNPGIATVEAQIRAQLREAVRQGVLVDNDQLRVVVPDVADVSDNDKASRVLNGVRFYGEYAGAIHKLKMNGSLSV